MANDINDITIIGGGPGGYVAAIQAGKMGAKVTLVEKSMGLLGGTCLVSGCIPTKTLVRSAEVYKTLQKASEYGITVGQISVDMKKVIERKNKIVRRLGQGVKYLLNKNNVNIVEGFGRIEDNETVVVKGDTGESIIKTRNIIIATGSAPSKLSVPGVDHDNVIDSKEALEMDELPKQLVIVGGGIIGMEFAFIYAHLGVQVTVIEFLDNVLDTLDEDISSEISKIAKSSGIQIYTKAKVEAIKESDSQSNVVFTMEDQSKELIADKVLMAVGRQPSFDGLGIEDLSMEFAEKGRGIKVNDKMETSIAGIYAIGDVTDQIQLAHVASHQGITAVKNILGQNTRMDYKAIPSAIFTDPEIAVIGMDEKTAQKENIAIKIGKFPFVASGKALSIGDTRGFVKIIANRSSKKVIGGSIIGPHATELIAEIALAIQNGLTTDQVAETVHAHPTLAEAVHEAALAALDGALHIV